MKKSMSLFALLVFALFSAQNAGYTFIYKVSYKPQKELKSEKVEYMALEVKNFKSKFYNLETKILDSLVAINDQSITNDTEMPNLKFTVYKDLKNSKTLVSSTFNQVEFIHAEEQIRWNLGKKNSFKVENYQIKEAYTQFGGRKWTVQYTPDIPVFDGPYIFSGLPGLVYKAVSEHSDYSFELVSIIKNADAKDIPVPLKNVNKQLYSKKLQEFIKDPGHHDILYKNIWGDQFHYKFQGKSPELAKEQEKQIQKIIDIYNNPIDKNVFLLNF